METAATVLMWVVAVSVGLPIVAWLLIFLVGLIVVLFKD